MSIPLNRTSITNQTRPSAPLRWCAALLATLISFTARIPSASSEQRAFVGFEALPQGELPDVPATIPGRIGPGERAPGFVINTIAGQSQVAILASQKLNLADGMAMDRLPLDLCYAVARPNATDTDREWPEDLEPSAPLSNRFGPGTAVAVLAVRRQQFARNGASGTLETRDAWVDPFTRGVRLIGRRSQVFERIGTFVGVSVYALRSAERVQFVIARPEASPQERRPPSDNNRAMTAERADGTSTSQRCDHIRTALATERGAGSSLTVRVPLVLGRETLKPARLPETTSPQTSILEERTRELGIHISTSWLSQDPMPIVSVTSGWLTRERRERSTEEAEEPQADLPHVVPGSKLSEAIR
jgi:hypothetical protein